jgi:hypothetical protein
MMRTIIITATLVMLSSSAWAQQQTPTTTGDALSLPPAAAPAPSSVPIVGPAPVIGSPQNPGTTVGMSRAGDDGVSTDTVKAVPCSTSARETDGSTTCIGIPERGAGRSRR